MNRIEVGPADLAASRFGHAPLLETLNALGLAAGRVPPGALRPWVERARPRYLAVADDPSCTGGRSSGTSWPTRPDARDAQAACLPECARAPWRTRR